MQCAYEVTVILTIKFHTDIPVPTPVPDEVLIKVGTAAVNNTFSLY
jgi:hypothetical protein